MDARQVRYRRQRRCFAGMRTDAESPGSARPRNARTIVHMKIPK